MNNKDLQNIKSYYELFNIMLFNNSLPRSNEVDFKLHNYTFAAGYCKYNKRVPKSGNVYEIAFCKYLEFDELQIREILVHEMIHLWQMHHVAEWRYRRCSNEIAHDKVFTSKMNTINLILSKNGFDIRVSEVYKNKIKLDKKRNSRVYYYVFFIDMCHQHFFFKVKEKYFADFINSIKNAHLSNCYAIKTKSYIYNILDFSKDTSHGFIKSIDNETNEDLYDKNINDINNIWIIKDNNFVYVN